MSYEEHGFAPGQHVLPVLSLRVGGEKKYLSDSSYVRPVRKIGVVTSNNADPKKSNQNSSKGRATAVPVCVMPDGKVLTDSWAILNHSKSLAAVTPSLRELLDNDLGPLTRQLIYHYILQDRNLNIWRQSLTLGRHWFWRFICWLFFGNFITKMMKKTFRVDDMDAVRDCREKLTLIFEKLDMMVQSKTGPFLNGSKLSQDDIALAALVAPVVMPPEYARGKFRGLFDSLSDQDNNFRDEVERWRNTETGKFVLWLYKEHRATVL